MMIRGIEEQSLNAWPALQTLHYDGWMLRFAAGYTRRANSIQPLYPSTLPLEAKVKDCEGRYSAFGQDTVFKLTAAAQPGELDDFLAQHGYERAAATSVQTLALHAAPLPRSTAFESVDVPIDAWLAAFCALNDVAHRHLPAMRGILHNLMSPACFGTLRAGTGVAALGLAVLQQEAVWLFDIVTAPEHRRQGLGRELVLHLLAWGQAQGASQAYLQVMQNNLPARSLYQQLGFGEVYEYWYRVKAYRPDLRWRDSGATP